MSVATSLVRQRVSKAISMWRGGQRPDARGYLEQHPEVRSSQSLVIDLAYEEFCLRQEAGEQLDTQKFLANFPTVQHSLARMLDVHGVMKSKAVNVDSQVDWPEAGTRWLDWDLVEPLGRGAFSRVFLAREPALGNREVVVKCSFAGPHEAFILGSLSHPNIVPIHSSRHDEARGLIGISMPLLGRSTLADALNWLGAAGNASRSAELFWQRQGQAEPSKRPTSLRGADYVGAVIALIARVASGLAAAHDAGVVHGDIKPSNVLLSFAGEPMLMDFNLSAGPGGDFERVGGTPPYMAPECLAGFWHTLRSDADGKLDPRSDLFSLGVVLLELLLGRIPIHFDLNRLETLPTEEAWQTLGHRAVASAREPKLQPVLDRCLAFRPDDRYQKAHELAADLEAIVDSKERIRRWTRRVAMVAGVGAVAGAALTLWRLTQEDSNSLPVLLRHAKEHIERGEFQDAVILLRQVQRQRQDANVRAWTGYCLVQLAQYESAKVVLKAAVQVQDSAELRNDLAYCCAKLHQSAEAEEHLERAIRLNPRLQAAWHIRANLRRDAAARQTNPLPEETWKDYEQAGSIGPRNGELYLDMAKAIAYANLRNQNFNIDLRELVRMALAAGVDPQSFSSTRFGAERLDLDQLEAQAKELRAPPSSPSASLVLPPLLPLPEQ